jgi:Rrf2 family transcriptional regulator, iron-sulfur cluster assembly transcription factor
MKITAAEEYGIRMLIRIASADANTGLSIPQLSEAEGLSEPHVAKICRTLRLEGFINSTPGNKGGYVLAKQPQQIIINDVLKALGGQLFDQQFCDAHTGIGRLCPVYVRQPPQQINLAGSHGKRKGSRVKN